MLEVSAQWHNASRQQFRYQAYLTAKLEVVPPGLREGANAESSSTFDRSDLSTLTDGITRDYTKYATLEPNRWVLDGTYTGFDDDGVNKTSDWWSDKFVSDSYKPTIRFILDKPYSIPGLFIVWDAVNQTYPRKIIVYGYDADNVLKYSVIVNDINSYEGFYNSAAMDDVQFIELVVDEWSRSNWRARIGKVVFGLVVNFDSVNNGRIMSATQTSKADPLNRKLPTHNLEIELRNYDKYFDPALQTGVSKYLAQQQILKAQWMFTVSPGNVEAAPEQVYLVENFNIDSDSKKVKMNLTNRIELLDNEFQLGTYTGESRTLREIAEYVLSSIGILREFDNQQPWIIPNTFDNISTTAPIPAIASNALLQLIALAGCTWLTVDGVNGFVQFAQSNAESSSYCAIDANQELGDPEITVSDRLRSVSVGVHNYSVASSTTEIGKAKYSLVETQTITIKYSEEYATEVSATVTNGNLVSASYYASYAVLTVSPTSANSEVVITISGKPIEHTVSYLEVYRNALIANGMDVVIDNSLITDIAHAQQVATYVKDYYLRRNTYKISYIGYPQAEPVDKISLTTIYGSDDVEVLGNTISFNGGWSGVMEAM